MSEAASGTLPETQVRAMFDRIAGVYDRMNGLMTAGMHHRWRERAADLAAVGPGIAGARRGHRHRRPGGGAARAGARRWWGSTSPSAMLELARAKAPDVRFEAGNALALPVLATASSTP